MKRTSHFTLHTHFTHTQVIIQGAKHTFWPYCYTYGMLKTSAYDVLVKGLRLGFRSGQHIRLKNWGIFCFAERNIARFFAFKHQKTTRTSGLKSFGLVDRRKESNPTCFRDLALRTFDVTLDDQRLIGTPLFYSKCLIIDFGRNKLGLPPRKPSKQSISNDSSRIIVNLL